MGKPRTKYTREMNEEQERWAEETPAAYKSTYVKAMTTKSLAVAVKAMCHSCNAYEDAFNRTKECDIKACPLWPHRHGNKEWPKTLCVGTFLPATTDSAAESREIG